MRWPNLVRWLVPGLVMVAVPAPVSASPGDRFESLWERDQVALRVAAAAVNDVLKAPSGNASTVALTQRHGLTGAEALSAAIATDVDGVAAGLALDLAQLAGDEPTAESMVFSLGTLDSTGARVGLAYAHTWRAETPTGLFCTFEYKAPTQVAKAEAKGAFVEACSAYVATFPGEAGHCPGCAADLRRARTACGLAPADPVASDRVRADAETLTAARAHIVGLWKREEAWLARAPATVGVTAQARRRAEPGLAAAMARVGEPPRWKVCSEKAALANWNRATRDDVSHAFGIGATVDLFPAVFGFIPEDERTRQEGNTPDERDDFNGAEVRLEASHRGRYWMLRYGVGYAASRDDPTDVSLTHAVVPAISYERAVVNLGEGTLAELREDDPRVTLGFDVEVELAVHGAAYADVLGGLRVTPRIDFAISELLKVRLAVPVRYKVETLAADPANNIVATSGGQWTLPVTLLTVFEL